MNKCLLLFEILDKLQGVRNFIFKAKDNIDNIKQKAIDYFNNWK